ncbi:hypothetical protein TNCT_333741 [Trichonephila clavata]|uniref:Uncharacterized protein n=1 Tax=Trichonephila clavata TaxID=2740835 RepID=A0A8X6I929_TRICU|nr:hypothetical protein TNCT_333741 [Trichonephila clavata]
MTILPHFSLAQWRGNSAKPPTPSRTLGRSLVTHSLVNDALLIEGNLEVSLTTPPMVEAIPATVEAVLTEVTTLSPPCVDNDTTSQRSNSPYVLDIIFAGELSQQSEADLNDLLSTWQEKLTGSPPSRAFGPPTYTATAKLGKDKRASVSKLWHCSPCH